MEQAGKVYLVGSGPGDAAYLTVQAQAILSQAEVLVYDALVDGALMDQVPETCLKLDVGKRGGQPSASQSVINDLLVKHCRKGKQVVRLKSGDPFIFGRAQAEVEALVQADCAYEVVPGLSSALTAPLLAGIPLTDPRLSRAFAVVTAHDADRLDWVSLSRMDTLVVLMGGRTLPEIVRRLRGHGRSPLTPIAIIRWAGRPDQQIWDGTLGNILTKTANLPLSPCVIVIGEVVQLRELIGEQGSRATGAQSVRAAEEQGSKGARQQRSRGTARITEDSEFRVQNAPQAEYGEMIFGVAQDLDGADEPGQDVLPPEEMIQERGMVDIPSAVESPLPNLPLTGKTVLVTRAASQSSQFTQLLKDEGARVIEMPTLEIGAPSSWRDLDRAIANLEAFNWLILTSTNGVDYFFQRLEAITGEPTFSTNIKIAVVGEKTAQRLERLGIQPDFVPPKFIADALVEHFPEPLSGLTVLFPRVESGGREVLVKEFINQGAKVREVAAYESRCPKAIAPEALMALKRRTVDIITFASSKTVQNFCQLLEQTEQDWHPWLEDVCIASIGPQTSQSCEALLGRVDIEAAEHTLDGLTQAIVEWATAPEPEEQPAVDVEVLAVLPDGAQLTLGVPLDVMPDATQPDHPVPSDSTPAAEAMPVAEAVDAEVLAIEGVTGDNPSVEEAIAQIESSPVAEDFPPGETVVSSEPSESPPAQPERDATLNPNNEPA